MGAPSPCCAGPRPRDDLGRIDEAQRHDQPDEGRRHIDHRHRVDRLAGAHAGREDRIASQAGGRFHVEASGRELLWVSALLFQAINVGGAAGVVSVVFALLG